jgi:hypothetical protein
MQGSARIPDYSQGSAGVEGYSVWTEEMLLSVGNLGIQVPCFVRDSYREGAMLHRRDERARSSRQGSACIFAG